MSAPVLAAINAIVATANLACIVFLFTRRPTFAAVGWIVKWRALVAVNAAFALWNLTLLVHNLSRITP